MGKQISKQMETDVLSVHLILNRLHSEQDGLLRREDVEGTVTVDHGSVHGHVNKWLSSLTKLPDKRGVF